MLQGFLESASVSPALVHRVIWEHGSGGVPALYFLPMGAAPDVEYLLRRFNGFYHRRRHPNISLVGVE